MFRLRDQSHRECRHTRAAAFPRRYLRDGGTDQGLRVNHIALHHREDLGSNARLIAAAPTIVKLLSWMYKLSRNHKDNDGTTAQLYNDDTTTVDQKSTVSEAAGTVDQTEWITGP